MTIDSEEVPVMLGKTIALHCAAVGVPTPTVTWLKDNRPLQTNHRITVGDDGTLLIKGAIPQDVGEYQCVGKSPAGKSTAMVVLWGEGGVFMNIIY